MALIKCYIISEVFSHHPNSPICPLLALGPSPYYSNGSIALELLVPWLFPHAVMVLLKMKVMFYKLYPEYLAGSHIR